MDGRCFAFFPRFSLVFAVVQYQCCHLRPKGVVNLAGGDSGIFYGIVQHTGNQHRQAGVALGENLQHLQRMTDIIQAAAFAFLSLMGFCGKLNGFVQ